MSRTTQTPQPRDLESIYGVPETAAPATPPASGSPAPAQPLVEDTSVVEGSKTLTLKIGRKTVTVPNPRYVASLEEEIKVLRNDLRNLSIGVRRIVEHQKTTSREIQSLGRLMETKVDRFG